MCHAKVVSIVIRGLLFLFVFFFVKHISVLLKPVNTENALESHKTNKPERQRKGERREKLASSNSRYTALFLEGDGDSRLHWPAKGVLLQST